MENQETGGHGLPTWPVSLSLRLLTRCILTPPPQGTWYLVITFPAHTSEPGAIWGLGGALVGPWYAPCLERVHFKYELGVQNPAAQA